MTRRAVLPADPTRPVVLVGEGPATDRVLADTRDRLRDAGWLVVPGLRARPALPRTVLEGRVTCDDDASAAVLAALAGYGLLLHTTLEGAGLHRLEDDLRRLGRLDRPATTHGEDGGAAPDPAGLQVLALLAEGHTLGEAAAALGLSRRTADRRLAAVRRALGAARTTEAIAVAARRGLFGSRPSR